MYPQFTTPSTHSKATKTMSTPSKAKLRKGAWDSEEDNLLRKCIEKYGEGKWHLVYRRSGLNRCRKSCRLRWLNYLRPTIKRGEFSEDEVDLIMRLHRLLGNRWTLIAGRLPGRTGNDVKNFWNTNIRRKHTPGSYQKEVEVNEEVHIQQQGDTDAKTSYAPPTFDNITIKHPPPFHNLNNQKHMSSPPPSPGEIIYNNNISMLINKPAKTSPSDHDGMEWWNSLLGEKENHGHEEALLKEWLMPSSIGLENLDAERGLTWQTNELFPPGTKNSHTIGWSDDEIWDLLNYDDYN